jgi:cobalt-zinc-cadmium efflux system protein
VNGGSALLFLRERHGDLNLRTQYLHLAGDAAVSLGVVLAALAMRLTGFGWLDPAASLAIAAVIAWGTWSALREAADLAMDAVPPGVALAEVLAWLTALPGVIEVHDLHIWALSTTETALTVHLVVDTAPADRGRTTWRRNCGTGSGSATRRCRSRVGPTRRRAGYGRTTWCDGIGLD